MDAFNRYAIRVSVAQICQIIGWSKIQSSPLEILTDFLQEYITTLAKHAGNYALLYGQSEPNLNHVALAFNDMGISVSELQEYVSNVETGCILEVPKYPIPKESNLNHLKPGSREVVTRPAHIHDHLPPMYPHLEEEEYLPGKSASSDDSSDEQNHSTPLKGEAHYNLREGKHGTLPEEEVRPLRELSSVLMTTSGFLSSAREGKLPEARTQPIEKSDSPFGGESSVAEEKNEVRKKPKLVDVPKKIDKENRSKEEKLFEKRESESKSKRKRHKHTKESKLKLLKHKRHKNSSSVSEEKKQEIQPFIPPTEDNVPIKQNGTLSPKIDKLSSPPPIDYSKEYFFEKSPYAEFSSKMDQEENKSVIDVLNRVPKLNEDNDFLKPVPKERHDNSLSFIDIFSVPQQHKIIEDHDFDDIDPQIDVESFSPLFNFDQNNIVTPITTVSEVKPDITDSGKEKKKKKKDKKHKNKDKNIKKVIITDSNVMDKVKVKKKKKKEKKVNEELFPLSAPVLESVPLENNETSIPLLPDIPPKKVKAEGEIKLKHEKKKDKDSLTNTAENLSYSIDDLFKPDQSFPINSASSTKEKVKDKKKNKKEKKKQKERLYQHLFESNSPDEKVKVTEYMSHSSENKPVAKLKPEENINSDSLIPKITFKLGPSNSSDRGDPHIQKVSIKPVLKSEEIDIPCAVVKVPEFQPQPFIAPKQEPDPLALVPKWEGDPNQIWICPACGRPDDGSPMIACDMCDLWFHWICVGIRENIESDWFCTTCLSKRGGKSRDKKKKHKKKKLK